jgi:heat shock protein HslJ
MRINQRWWYRPAHYLLSAFAFVVLISTAPAQTQKPLLDFLGTTWLLEDLGGAGVIDNAQATLSFPERGKVIGNGSCNRFFAPVEITGDLVRFGTIGATRKQCADAVSDQELRYLKALESTDRMSVDGEYLFLHSKSLDKPLRFTRLQKP